MYENSSRVHTFKKNFFIFFWAQMKPSVRRKGHNNPIPFSKKIQCTTINVVFKLFSLTLKEIFTTTLNQPHPSISTGRLTFEDQHKFSGN
jgi:hypothetical protein